MVCSIAIAATCVQCRAQSQTMCDNKCSCVATLPPTNGHRNNNDCDYDAAQTMQTTIRQRTFSERTDALCAPLSRTENIER